MAKNDKPVNLVNSHKFSFINYYSDKIVRKGAFIINGNMKHVKPVDDLITEKKLNVTEKKENLQTQLSNKKCNMTFRSNLNISDNTEDDVSEFNISPVDAQSFVEKKLDEEDIDADDEDDGSDDTENDVDDCGLEKEGKVAEKEASNCGFCSSNSKFLVTDDKKVSSSDSSIEELDGKLSSLSLTLKKDNSEVGKVIKSIHDLCITADEATSSSEESSGMLLFILL